MNIVTTNQPTVNQDIQRGFSLLAAVPEISVRPVPVLARHNEDLSQSTDCEGFPLCSLRATTKRIVNRCAGHVVTKGHSDHGVGSHKWIIPIDCCGLVNCTCPACINRHTRRRADRIFKLYSRLFATIKTPGVGCYVFTLPAEFHESLTLDLLKKLRSGARAVVGKVTADVNNLKLRVRKKPGWEIGGVDVIHPEGDKDPGQFKPHIHLQVPAVAWHNGNQAWGRLKLKLPKEAIEKIRVLWGEVLVGVLGWEGDVSKCDVHYSWRSVKKLTHLRHRVKYDFRHWAEYEGQWRRVTWFGFLGANRVGGLGLVLGKENVNKMFAELYGYDIFKQERNINACPRCGCLSEIEFPSGADPGAITENLLIKLGAPGWLISAAWAW